MKHNNKIFLTTKKEAEYLAKRCIEFLRFFDTIEKDKFLFEWIDNFMEAIEEEDIAGLRTEYADFIEQAQDLLPEQYKTLDKILKDKFGEGLFEADKKHVKRINKIVEKGKIKTEVQYYLLREYFERIWDMIEYKNTAGKIEKMLYVFENKIKK